MKSDPAMMSGRWEFYFPAIAPDANPRRLRFPRAGNGVLEAINSLVQAVRARTRGYRTTGDSTTMVYRIAG